jgi:hypothetical protein
MFRSSYPSGSYHQVTRDLFKLDCDDRVTLDSNSLDCDDQTPLRLFDTVVRDLY